MRLKYIDIIIGIIILGFPIFSTVYYKKLSEELAHKVSVSKSNEKAFISENDNLTDSNRELQLTVSQLNYFNDSLLKAMNNVRKEIGVKDKQVESLQYLLTKASRHDTIQFRDTIFMSNITNVDTIIKDDWYNVKLGLNYPSTISITPTFISEKYIVLSYKKETIDPPKKFFLLRWFQKKHKIIKIDIVEKNPYINNIKQRYIRIIK